MLTSHAERDADFILLTKRDAYTMPNGLLPESGCSQPLGPRRGRRFGTRRRIRRISEHSREMEQGGLRRPPRGGSGGRFSEDVPSGGAGLEFVAGFRSIPGKWNRGAVGGPIPSRAGGQDDGSSKRNSLKLVVGRGSGLAPAFRPGTESATPRPLGLVPRSRCAAS